MFVGSVRAMVVAGQEGAYGNAEKTAFVRTPLMMLSTLPRVLSIQEEITVPVNIFAMENQVKNVQDIIKRGTLLYEKIAGFTDTFLRIGDNLSGLQRDYDKAYNQLSDGNGSVVRQAELLRNMSLTPKKRISARLLPKEEETEEEENGQDK